MGWNSTLNRKKPMARTGFKPRPWIKDMADKIAAQKGDRLIVRKNKVVKKRSTLKKVSKSMRGRLKTYYPLRDQFLIDNPSCAICPCRGLKPAPSSEVHHKRGRAGKLLCDVRFFIPSCRGCREWPHEHATLARELGILAPVGEWNVFPRD